MAKNRLRVWPLYSLLLVFTLTTITFVCYGYLYSPKIKKPDEQVAAVVVGKEKNFTKDDPWQLIYQDTQKMKINDLIVDTSVAKTWPERIKGLSGTPYLPEHLVKLFIFDTPAFHSIWMKDMLYDIDILWVDTNNKIIHIEEKVSPDSYPDLFVPNEPALYVIETAAGFIAKNKIKVGDDITLPLLK